MSLTRLQDDLLHDFKEQKAVIEQQLEVFDPMGMELAKPAARRLVSKSILIITEILCYLLSLGSIAFAVFLTKLYPFYILEEIKVKPEYSKLGNMTVSLFNLSIYAMIGLMALLFFLLGMAVNSIRRKNDILHFAGKHIKTLVSQHLKRRAAIETIEQRHFMEMPVVTPAAEPVKVNEVPNPGYEG